ncbi:R3H and coiled-coil domain-containing protein 1-like, partial [Toxocara canis]
CTLLHHTSCFHKRAPHLKHVLFTAVFIVAELVGAISNCNKRCIGRQSRADHFQVDTSEFRFRFRLAVWRRAKTKKKGKGSSTVGARLVQSANKLPERTICEQMGDYEVFPIAEDLSSFAFPPKRASRRSERAIYVPLAKRIQLSSGTSSEDRVDCSGERLFDTKPRYSTSARDHMLARLMRRSMEHDPHSSLISHSSNVHPPSAVLGELVFVVEQPLSGLPLVESLFTKRQSPLRDVKHLQSHPSSNLPRPSPSPDSCSNIKNNNVPSKHSTGGGGEGTAKQRAVDEEGVEEKSAFSDEFEDAEFTASVLNNLPTSYDDFETKELHLKLERNMSSPHISCQSPATDCGRLSAGSNSTIASTMHPILESSNMQPDAEDLEVAMINESFEEQQKQTKLYENPDLKDLFYSHPNIADDADAILRSSRDHLPYAVAMVGSELNKDRQGATVDLSKRYIPHTDHRFTPVLTPNSSEMVAERCTPSIQHGHAMPERRPFDPLFNSSENSDNGALIVIVCIIIPQFEQEFGDAGTGEFDVEEMILDESTLRRASRGSAFDTFSELQSPNDGLKESRRDFMKAQKSAAIPIKESRKLLTLGSADEKMDATEALAMDVVESLFSGSGPLGQRSPSTPHQNKMSEVAKSEDEEGPKELEEVLAPPAQSVHDAYCSSLADGSASVGEGGKAKGDVGTTPVDSWEELDSEDFDFKVGGIKSAMEKVNLGKPKIDYFIPPPPTLIPWNDRELPHVLEIHALPSRITLDNVKDELAKFDCADVTFQKVNDSSYLINFSSLNAALKALMEARQGHASAWLHLRRLSDASFEAQEVARKYASLLVPHKPRPRTTAMVARRLVEGALGVRVPVSREQRNAERQILNEAREQKKVTAALWEDNR